MTWLITLSENNCSVVAFTKRNRSSHPRCSVRKGVLRNFVKFTRKHLCHSIFFNKVPGLRPATLLKNRLWHRCFPVNFAKFLRTPFLQNTSGRLLLKQRENQSAIYYKMQWLGFRSRLCIPKLQVITYSKLKNTH